MNKAEQKRAQQAFRRAFNNSNHCWEFNGRTFETGMEIYRSGVWIRAVFESGPSGVTVWMHIGRAFKQMIDVDGPQQTFRGENAMVNALNYLADWYLQTIDKVQKLEREALKQATPQISPDELRKIFDPGQISV